MSAPRTPAYIVVLFLLAAMLLMAATITGLLSLGRYSNSATILTAAVCGTTGITMACVAAWMNDVIAHLRG
jgi:hypothetical protein